MDELPTLISSLSASPLVVGLLLAGSRARGDDLPQSDVDLFVLVGSTEAVPRIHELIGLTRPTVLLAPRYVHDFGWNITCLYAGGTVVQFNINDRTSVPLNPMRGKGRILYDPHGWCEEIRAAGADLHVDIAMVRRSTEQRLLVRLLLGVRALAKGELLGARSLFMECVTLLAALRRIEQGAFDPAMHWSHPLKRLEGDLPAVARELGTLCTGSTEQELAADATELLTLVTSTSWDPPIELVQLLDHEIATIVAACR